MRQVPNVVGRRSRVSFGLWDFDTPSFGGNSTQPLATSRTEFQRVRTGRKQRLTRSDCLSRVRCTFTQLRNAKVVVFTARNRTHCCAHSLYFIIPKCRNARSITLRSQADRE